MRNNCVECEELFNAYRASVLAHVKAQGQLDIARAAYDYAAVQRLQFLVRQAAERREQVRGRFREHERAAHALRAEAE